jgi:hypothetical protein
LHPQHQKHGDLHQPGQPIVKTQDTLLENEGLLQAGHSHAGFRKHFHRNRKVLPGAEQVHDRYFVHLRKLQYFAGIHSGSFQVQFMLAILLLHPPTH